jgi:hypothetical protein
VAGSCRHGYEPTGFIKVVEFLNCLKRTLPSREELTEINYLQRHSDRVS